MLLMTVFSVLQFSLALGLTIPRTVFLTYEELIKVKKKKKCINLTSISQ